MAITLTQLLSVGNAVRLFVEPPAWAVRWRLLRKTVPEFSGWNDPGASLIASAAGRDVVLDISDLVNGTPYYYAVYGFGGAGWALSGNVVAAVPAATQEDASTDVLGLIRERLELGLQVYVARGTLHHRDGKIRCLFGPALRKDDAFPVVTVELTSDSSADHAIGDQVGSDEQEDGGWTGYTGWHSRVEVVITGWSLNPDERKTLDFVLRQIIVVNGPVWAVAGLHTIDYSSSWADHTPEEMGAPVYAVVGRLSCLAPVAVGDTTPAITDVTINLES